MYRPYTLGVGTFAPDVPSTDTGDWVDIVIVGQMRVLNARVIPMVSSFGVTNIGGSE